MAENNVQATLKAGKGYDAPWLNFQGGTADEVKRHIAEAVGMDLSVAEAHSLAEVVVFGNETFAGTSNVVRDLGATPVAVERTEVSPTTTGGSEDKGVWEQAKAKKTKKAPAKPTKPAVSEEQEEPGDPILAAIAEAKSVAALRRLWSQNKGAWSDEHSAAVEVRKGELEAA